MACLTSLLGSISAAALVSWAAYELYKHCTKDQDKRDADQEEGAGDYKLPTLRTRPLKPAVDLEFYTYM